MLRSPDVHAATSPEYAALMHDLWAVLHFDEPSSAKRVTAAWGHLDEDELGHERSRRSIKVSSTLLRTFPISWRACWALTGDTIVGQVMRHPGMQESAAATSAFPLGASLDRAFLDVGAEVVARASIGWLCEAFAFEAARVDPRHRRSPRDVSCAAGSLAPGSYIAMAGIDIAAVRQDLEGWCVRLPWDHAVRVVRARSAVHVLIVNGLDSVVLTGRDAFDLRWLWSDAPLAEPDTSKAAVRELLASSCWAAGTPHG